MVTNYTPNNCTYRLDKLDKVVYLISDRNNIHIDSGNCWVETVEEEPIALECFNIALSESDTLDERYKFNHQLTFSVNGYMNHRDFHGKYYAVVKSLNGSYWLLNPKFPCKVTYTYTLNSIGDHSDFTLSTPSNHPVLNLINFHAPTPKNCSGYTKNIIKSVRLNEKKYSLNDSVGIKYTNDGFKTVLYDKNSASFSEQFDGDNVTHSLRFNIKFDDYKLSWHYNLLEFIDNKYAAIIENSNGKYILCGFGFGLNPSFTITANDETTPDNIEILLSDIHDSGSLIILDDQPNEYYDSSKRYEFTTEHYGYECVGINRARYLLKKEVDALGNPTNRYMCLIGYESRFGDLNIIGTFDETEEFVNPSCGGEQCLLQTSLPNTLKFETRTCRQYSLLCDSDWNLVSSSPYITVSPNSGSANTPYIVEVCNDYEATYTSLTASITATYCNGSATTFTVIADKTNACFPAGQTFDISANGQFVTIPIQCCVQRIDNTTIITNTQIFDNYIRVYVPQNNGNTVRTLTLTVVFCDGTTDNITINQALVFERWVFESTTCSDGLKCDVYRRYTGTSASDINVRTNQTRLQNCVESSECSTIITRWIDSSDTTCWEGRKYIVQIEQISEDGGVHWSETGNKRIGSETEDSPAECEREDVEEKWEELPNAYVCNDTVKYSKEQLFTRVVGTVDWIPQNVFRRGARVIEVDSTDCGYVLPTTAWTCTKWVADDGYICEGTTKYARNQLYVSLCNDCENCDDWIPYGAYMLVPTVLEVDSPDCGYDPTLTGNCSEWRDEGDTVCNGFSAYTYLRKYVRECFDCNVCSTPWIQTNIYKRGSFIKDNSFDCGFIPATNYFNWVVEGTMCDGYSKYEQERKYISQDGTNWYRTNILRQGTLIEAESEDCGFVPPIPYEYRWLLTDRTTCVGTDKYYEYKYQRRRSGTTEWEDVIPSRYSYNGDGTMQPHIAEYHSTDCGYVPPVEPIYDWRLVPNDYLCDECGSLEYRWVTMNTYCNGDDLYAHQKLQYKYQGGSWTDTDPLETQDIVIEYSSSECVAPEPIYDWRLVPNDYLCDDCPVPQYRWITANTYCNGADLYAHKVEQVSYDGGSTWTNTGVTDDVLIEAGSAECQPVPPTPTLYKVVKHYGTGNTNSVQCNSESALTQSEVRSGRSYTAITSAEIGDCVKSISAVAFINCSSLSSVTIPDSVTRIGDEAFHNCSAMTTCHIGSGVTRIDYGAFENCGLTSITIPNGVTSLGNYAFAYCSSLPSITIPDSVTSINKGTFQYCSAMTTCTIGSGLTSTGEWTFSHCTSLTNVTIPNSVTNIGGSAFQGCSSLSSVTIPDSVTSISPGAFDNCITLTSVTIPDSVTTIGQSAFSNCSAMTTCNIGSGVTSIGNSAFTRCYSLTSVTIGSGVREIGQYDFAYCSGLTSITITATTPPTLGYYAFSNISNFSIFVPEQSIIAYKTASGWSNYASRIYPIP